MPVDWGAYVVVGGAVGAGVWYGYHQWNKKMLAAMKEEVDKAASSKSSDTSSSRIFLLGSEKFGFLWRWTEPEVRFFCESKDGKKVWCVFPVSALRTAAAAALLAAVMHAAGVAPPPADVLNKHAKEVQSILATPNQSKQG